MNSFSPPPPPPPDRNVKAEAEFDEFAKSYSEQINEDYGSFSRWRDTFFIWKTRYLKSILKAEPKGILDFGCGIGSNIPYLRQYFPNAKLYGCDISGKSLKIAKENYRFCDFEKVIEPSKLEIFRDKIDIVFISVVVHHIPTAEHQIWLKNLYEVLPDGGYIFIFENNMKNPIVRNILWKGVVDREIPMLSLKYIRNLVSNIFQKTHIRGKEIRLKRSPAKGRYAYFFPWRNIFFESIEKLLFWLPLGAQYCVYAKKG
jgi:SAM-dependent methyltransferase